MAFYKYRQFLERRDGVEFDDRHPAGTVAPLSGVYVCDACGTSVTALNGRTLPGPVHHRHEDDAPIAWRLAVCSHHK